MTSKPHQEANTLSHNYWTWPDLVNTQFTPHTTRIYCNTSLERSEQSLLFFNAHSSTYVGGERQQGRVPRPAVANDWPGFLSATTSIPSELDDSASQRHRSVGGILLWLAAYVKRILHHQKSKANPLSIQTLNDRLKLKTLRGMWAKSLFVMCRCIHVTIIQLQLRCQEVPKII